jgi:N-acetylglucosaminyldiphosphoundecaprenol N-acetyl-beta-D-mannosaminyltransferase
MGYRVYSGSLDDIRHDQALVINTLNQYSFCIAEEDSVFREALRESDVLLPDGIAIVAAVRLLSGKKITKIAGADLHEHMLKSLNTTGGKVFYLGSSESTLEMIRARLQKEYPQVKAEFFSPPFKEEFSTEDNQSMLDKIRQFSPQVLFVGMTAPKQEKWVHENSSQIPGITVCSIGAVFDFYAGTISRPPVYLRAAGLEWLGRLLSEPKRMWKRYLFYGPKFGFRLIAHKLKKGEKDVS